MSRKQLITVALLHLLLIMNAEAQERKQTLTHGEGSIDSVRFMQDGIRLVSASYDGTVILWDIQKGKSIWSIDLDGTQGGTSYTNSNILAMDLSPDGCTIAVSYERAHIVNNQLEKSDEYLIGLLDTKNGREKSVLVGSSARALRLSFSPDGQLLASGGPDGKTRLWNISTGRPDRTVSLPRGVSALAFSTTGKLLAIGQALSGAIVARSTPDLVLCDVESGEVRQDFRIESGYVIDAAFSPDGTLLAVAGQEPYEIALISTATWKVARSLNDSQVHADRISFSRDGRLLASGESGSLGGRIFVWDARSRNRSRSFSLPSGVQTISFSPDGTMLAAGTADGKVTLLHL